MSTDMDNPPDQWSGAVRVPGSPDPGVFILIRDQVEGRPLGSRIVVWHWHTPTEPKTVTTESGTPEPRWQASGCDRHTVISLEPLHLEPSLACENGCPNHGWIRNGVWTDA